MSSTSCSLPSQGQNFFNTVQVPFPELDDGKIDTFQFLEAAKCVVSLIDSFGKVFTAVVYDMHGNIQKLTCAYDENKERYSNLTDMILSEQQEGGMVATDALLWLQRALHLVQRFFELILEDNELNKKSDDLSVFLTAAYRETLYQHHGWMAQQLFTVLSKMCPDRRQLMKTICLNREHKEEAALQDMAKFTSSLRINIEALAQFYKDNNLDSTEML